MRKTKTLVFSAMFCTALTGYSNAEPVTLNPRNFGLFVRNEGCEKAAIAVNHEADPELFIGIMYELGLCRPKDPAEALVHYRLSARNGNDKAMYAFYVLSGRSDAPWTPKQREDHSREAMEFLQRSAHMGNRDAAYTLSVCLEFGACGLKKNLIESQRLRTFYNSNHQP